MGNEADTQAAARAFAGGGEMGALIRAKDWATTALGPVSGWPQSLRTAVSLMLHSRYPMFVFWGPRLIKIYNQAYRPITGEKHPWALGQPAESVWPEIWEDIAPLIERVVRRGEATWHEDLRLFMQRRGFTEEVFFTFSYSPIHDESGGIGGLFCACTETTTKVLGERRLKVLHDLAAATSEARSVDDVVSLAANVLATNPQDIPFADIDLDNQRAWPLGQHRIADLGQRLDPWPAGPWPEPPHSVMVLPVPPRSAGAEPGIVALGISSRLEFDEAYRGCFELVASQIATSIANARATEEERQRAQALAELDRAKTAFFSNVSHEFRTPLTLLLGPVDDLLADVHEPPSTGQRERLLLVRRNAVRLEKLVNTLLAFSRIEAGRMQARFARTDLSGLTADLASVFRSAVERAGLRFNVDCPPLGEPVYVDHDMWERIVLNLLSNALKFTFEGELRIALRMHDEHVTLEVRDTGTGIPAEDLAHVFERFRRVEGARGRTHEGTGIGLALVHELVRLHGGEVQVHSEVGHGSTFTVTLPRGHAHLPPDQIIDAPTRSGEATTAQSYVDEALGWLGAPVAAAPAAATTVPRQRVVLADDNADMRGYVQRLLEARYDVEAVADGEAALNAVRRAGADLVISDSMMPTLDGIQLARALRADPATRTVPLMILSARADEASRIDGLRAGADDYVFKPFNASELLARVDSMLRAADARVQAEAAVRLSEQRLREFADTAPAILWTTDPQGHCTFISRGWVDYTGQSVQAALGLGWLEPVHADDREEAGRIFLDANRARRPFSLDYRLRRADGVYRWAIDAGRPRFDAEGNFLGFVGSVIDMHERHTAELALRDADRRKDEFLAMLSHELRNPLAPLRNALHLLRLTPGDEARARKVHDMMARQVDHLVRLVDDLLETSRISRGKLELRRERVTVADVMRNAVETCTPLMEVSHHHFDVNLPDGSLTVDGDPVRLAQVLANLLNNAAKYTPPNGEVSLRAWREGGQVVIAVRDNGDGIEPDELPRMFEMFTRGHGDAPQLGGLGIGLSLARRLVQLHGGTIEGRSEGRGRGSEFLVRLPLLSDTVAALSPRSERETAASPIEQRILVVDDNADAGDSLGMLLQHLGADVRIARDGYQALDLFESYRPTAVLLDVGMPGLSGYDVARELRRRFDRHACTIVALTGWGQDQDRQRAREAGFDHHFVKPVDIGTLQALLTSLPRSRPRERAETT